MKKEVDVARAWRDEEYRNSLSPEERSALPEHPAGVVAVDDAALQSVTGGCGTTVGFGTCSRPGLNCYPR